LKRYRPSVSARDPKGEEAAPALTRLPPGRHGLPREFVTENQRSRLTAGIIAVIAEQGYRDATISQIAAAAGVSRRTFYSYFASKQECFLDAYDQIGAHLREAGSEAAGAHSEWTDRVAAKLRAALETFAANPDLARFYLVEAPRAGDEIAAHYRRGAILALADLTEGMPTSARRPSETIEYAVMGGVAALIADRVLVGEGEQLPALLPDLLELVLTPYLGREEAVGAARRICA
jgi:AcrR family transcriptional regulator